MRTSPATRNPGYLPEHLIHALMGLAGVISLSCFLSVMLQWEQGGVERIARGLKQNQPSPSVSSLAALPAASSSATNTLGTGSSGGDNPGSVSGNRSLRSQPSR